MAKPFRAKVTLRAIEKNSYQPSGERQKFSCVSGGKYGPNGENEDNSFARYTPDGNIELTVTNPDLVGAHELGTDFYVDFTPIEKAST